MSATAVKTGPLVLRTISSLREELSARRAALPQLQTGLVPTMGYLHDGHGSLIRRSAAENGLTVLSIFVNPLQFGPNEDLDRYPRDEERDLLLARQQGADIVFMPSVEEMYPRKPLTRVLVSEVTEALCGASRPGHFDGVGTVVSKLLHLVKPQKAYFGLKDAQQVAVVQQMVDDLNIDVEIVPCPTVREQDGLALSSRNVYLTPEQREQALVLSRTLRAAAIWAEEPGMTAGGLEARVRSAIAEAPLAAIDYAELRSYPSLEALLPGRKLSDFGQPMLLALAVKFGSTRLIDNAILH
ncbi:MULTISPECIES: pantoate--beta-alanine ligase [unclassified Paenibacillus]|uniref:pantoate--beta-alanine ligase n=1 Tax=unclassified Paenibacillus TaxID=185978 RepID=UPI000956A29D|nr:MULTISPECIES: pantoate--beta-alanine ligase [unclassified Paenibacillus]ASS65156.1 pantoate--beta-alanine ligase [Paenibacillus sp. RUD330]SIQ46124.1 pantoate--beta-alanine ligase [Paenibacillus sp. RU4X]SIQ68154.1 pantoate--beta-alanine ligase [Paenibacillus sp. RU4T]